MPCTLGPNARRRPPPASASVRWSSGSRINHLQFPPSYGATATSNQQQPQLVQPLITSVSQARSAPQILPPTSSAPLDEAISRARTAQNSTNHPESASKTAFKVPGHTLGPAITFSSVYIPNPIVRIKESYPVRLRTRRLNPQDPSISFAALQTRPGMTSHDGTLLALCLKGIGLQNPNERLFTHLEAQGKSVFFFMFTWPACTLSNREWKFMLSIYGGHGLITRRELAFYVARCFQTFLYKCEQGAITCADPKWRVGTQSACGGPAFALGLDTVELVSLFHNVFASSDSQGDVWQATFRTARWVRST